MKKKLINILILIFFYHYSNAQTNTSTCIYVRFIDGITQTASVDNGKQNIKITFSKASVKNSLKKIQISEDSITIALPTFNISDTLKIRPNGMKVSHSNMSKLYKIKINKNRQTEVLNQLRSMSDVLYAEPEITGSLYTIPNDTRYQEQYALFPKIHQATGKPIYKKTISAEAAWSIYNGNPNNIIAIVDGAVENYHEDLQNKISGGDQDYNTSYRLANPDTYTHGTRVSGIAAASSNNDRGICGVDWMAKIHPQTWKKEGEITGYNAIMDAVNYSPNVHVINCSWGTESESTIVREAIAYAYKNNRTIVAAIGNVGEVSAGANPYPAASNHVIAVGSTNYDGQASGSISRNYIDLCAPGMNILTTSDGYYSSDESGSSLAAPHVSGVASLLKGYQLSLANDDIENLLKLSADKVDGMAGANFTTSYGYGFLNAEKALNYLRPPYKLLQKTTGSGNIANSVNLGLVRFIGAMGLASTYYSVNRIEIQKTISLPENITNIVGIWGRGVFSSGWSQESPNYGEGFCEVVPGSITATTATLRTYVYDVYSQIGQHIGYRPCAPENAVMAYTVLATSNGLSELYTQDVYIQNEIINANRHTYGKDFYIGSNVTPTIPQGNVTINSGANVLTEGQTLTLQSGFECVSGSTFEFKNLEPM